MDMMMLRRQCLAYSPGTLMTASGNPVVFDTKLMRNLAECKAHFSPVQEGTGDPSPDNVRAISGWTGCEVYQAGANLIDEAFLSDVSNYVNQGSYGYWYTDYIQLAPSTRYRFVWFDFDDTQMLNCNLYVDGASEYIISNGTHRQYPKGFTTSATGRIRFGINRGSYGNIGEALVAAFQSGKLLFQIGTDDVSYEPYFGTTHPIDWTTEAGAVYGGYVDLVSGEVVQEFYSIPPSSWQFMRQNNGFKAYSSPKCPTTINGGAWYCNKVKEYGSFNSSNMNKNIIQKCGTAIGELGMVYLSLDENVDVSTIQVVYIINTPIRHPIDPAVLKTLRGTNTVWSNTNGTIDLSYRK